MSRLVFSVLLFAAVTAASAQTPSKKSVDQLKVLYDQHQADFDYLLGDWEFTTVSKQYGPGKGYWSAIRLAGGQILDEFRIVGDAGETYYVTATIRVYNAERDRWELISMTGAGGLQDFGTGRRQGGEVTIEQHFDVASDHPSLLRIRYSNLQADRFSWKADRSTDGGKTWVIDAQRIEARRIGPPRSIESLTATRKASEK